MPETENIPQNNERPTSQEQQVASPFNEEARQILEIVKHLESVLQRLPIWETLQDFGVQVVYEGNPRIINLRNIVNRRTVRKFPMGNDIYASHTRKLYETYFVIDGEVIPLEEVDLKPDPKPGGSLLVWLREVFSNEQAVADNEFIRRLKAANTVVLASLAKGEMKKAGYLANHVSVWSINETAKQDKEMISNTLSVIKIGDTTVEIEV